MEVAFVIVGLAFLIGFLRGLLQKKDKSEVYANAGMEGIAYTDLTADKTQEVNSGKETNIMENLKYSTQQLMVSTLTQIGCQPKVNDDDTVLVTYQGEHFHIDFGGRYANIWDLGWAGVNVNDPELPKIKEAVNHTNFNFGPTVVFTNPDDNGTVYFHSRMGILLHSEIPDVNDYVRSQLDMFFRTKDAVRQNFQQISIEQQRNNEKRRPVGFAASAESTENSNV